MTSGQVKTEAPWPAAQLDPGATSFLQRRGDDRTNIDVQSVEHARDLGVAQHKLLGVGEVDQRGDAGLGEGGHPGALSLPVRAG